MTEEQLVIKLMQESALMDINLLNEWGGDLGWWYLNVSTGNVYVNPLFLMTMGYDNTAINNTIPIDTIIDVMDDEDAMYMASHIKQIKEGTLDVLEMNFRLTSLDGRRLQFFINGKRSTTASEMNQAFIVGTAYDVTNQFLSKKELKEQAEPKHQAIMQDALTSLLNRHYFEEHLHHAITLAKAGQQSFCLTVLDIDFFKNINEHFGRDKGDEVLKEVGVILKKETRTSDHIGRIGGDNFHVILTDVDFRTGQMISERIRKSIANHMFVSGIRITISGGLVHFAKQSYEDLINTAHTLLKKSKNTGSNKMSY